MTGTESGGSGMFVESGQDVMLAVDDDDDDDDGDSGEPPALLPFSQFVFDAIKFDDGRRTSAGRFDVELVDNDELLGGMT
jgi:hypothetical protein